MISGPEERMGRSPRYLALALIAGACIVPASAETAPPADNSFELGQLMRGLHAVKSASAQFVERKTLHILSEPLVTSGTLLYVAPDQVQKITILPQRERFAISGDVLTIEGGASDRPRILSLADHPEIAGFVEGIRATLAGDLAALSRFYVLQLEGSAADWRLSLQPKEPKLRELLKAMRISGSYNKIREIETEEGDGDRSDMSIDEQVQ
jgi:hypothetical protein